MHNVRHVRRSAEQQAARRRKEAVEIERFQKLQRRVLTRPQQRADPTKAAAADDDADKAEAAALADIEALLNMDSDFYTAYNIRREIIDAASEERRAALLKRELELTERLFPTNPKSYWIWNHRRWVLERMDLASAWEREMALVNKLLEKDMRNFHGWGYRAWLIERQAAAPGSDAVSVYKDMLEYTTAKINKNFSNFSAWHYRAQALKQLKALGAPSPASSYETEVDYAMEACGMDPNDQSAWLYLRWLAVSPNEAFANVSEASKTSELIEFAEEIFEEEHSIYAGRLLLDLNRLEGTKPDEKVVNELITLDPGRAQRYRSLLAHAS